MNLTWGELWLLETAVHAWIPLRFLVHPEIDQLFNKPGHHLDLQELADALERLRARGDVVLRTDSRGPHVPSRDQLFAALVYAKGRRPPNGLHYGLTRQGGERWEQAAGADWSRYVRDSLSFAAEDDDVVGPRCEITGMDRARVEAALAASRRDVLPGTLTWDRLEPWPVTPWKTLPGAYRVRFRCGPERPPTFREAPLPKADHWFERRTLVPGAMFSVPLEGRRRGLLRVLATLPCDAEHPDPYHFVIACDPGDAALPANLARVGRRFLGLIHESWKGRLLGEWTAGAPPESFRFEGVVEVTPEEHAMAISSWGSGTWDWFPRALSREWRWRHDRSEYDRVQAREHEEAKLARARRTPAELAALQESERTTMRRTTEVRSRVLALQAPEPPEARAAWAKQVRLDRWREQLETALRRLLAPNIGAGGRLDRYDLRVEDLSADGLTFDVVLGFRAGESYCCCEPECHLALYDRVVWDRLREHLLVLAPALRPPGLKVRRVLGEVARGTRLEVRAQFGIAPVVGEPERYEARGWVERETLRSGVRSRGTR